MTGGGLYGTDGDDLGHGHVVPRPDGLKRDCGGPGRCPLCAAELAQQQEGNAAVARRRAARAALLAAPVQHDRRIVLGTPRGWSSLAWFSRCTCGEFESDPIAHDLSADSSVAIAAVRDAWFDHALGARIGGAADVALAQWARS